MEVFVARQPIFDRHQVVHAYELLFRSGLENVFDQTRAATATSELINNGFFAIGADRLLAGRRAFINFTRKLLLEDCAALFPPQSIVIEVLESVELDAEIVDCCRQLKSRGYVLALDDVADPAACQPLVGVADILKIDYATTSPSGRETLVKLYRKKARLLAEKIETLEQFEEARKLGYDYFQGFFFGRPKIVTGHGIPGNKLHYLRLLAEVNRRELRLPKIEHLISQDVSLTYKLFLYMNSAAFGWRARIRSVRQALALLGEDQLRTWVSAIAVSAMAKDKPAELVVNSMVRARFCESLAPAAGLVDRQSDLFLMGMFSHLNAMLDRPMDELLKEIDLPGDVRHVLVDRGGIADRLASVYDLVLAYEGASWETLSPAAASLGCAEGLIPELYTGAVNWAHTNLSALESA